MILKTKLNCKLYYLKKNKTKNNNNKKNKKQNNPKELSLKEYYVIPMLALN